MQGLALQLYTTWMFCVLVVPVNIDLNLLHSADSYIIGPKGAVTTLSYDKYIP